ncbi:unnamed protein product [Knipowitschia caucasica]|uniref:ADP-ribosylation factor-binding protein GGA2 n=1 Tax=Knipowitschia caucasica TaxID=637954 RepID=A0AAV2LKP0_KNICA
MASAHGPASLESLLNQATDPQNQEERWESIQSFTQTLKQQSDGPQVAVRLLAHKIQSPQEREALQALTVLEACMNECGKKFHSEVAKFRFLNELIKVLSPKYFGAWSPEKVKQRLVEVLYGWTLWLRDQPKIQEAYDMLKKQDIVKKDPQLSCALIMPPAPQRSSASIFEQDDTTKLLDRLLKSGRPEDLETANRLIKSTMQAEQERAARVQRREELLQEVHSSSRQLQDVLERPAREQIQRGQDIQDLFERCDRLRPTLFRLASETAEDDEALSRVLEANDELTLAVNAYRAHMSAPRSERPKGETQQPSPGHLSLGHLSLGHLSPGHLSPGHPSPVSSPREVKAYHLIDLSALDPELSSPPQPSLQKEGPTWSSVEGEEPQKTSYLEELIQLDEEVFSPEDELWEKASNETHSWLQPYLELQSDMFSESSTSPRRTEEPSLQDVFVPVHCIRASHLEPIPLLDQAGVHVSLHFSRDPPLGRPGVAVLVLSTVNTSALRVRGFRFQAAVPKSMCVKLQPASGCELPPYSPLLPPAALSQVLLLDNPQEHAVRLRYKLSLTHGEQQLDESGEISTFPPWSRMIGQ